MNALIGVIDFLGFDIPISQPRSRTFAPGTWRLAPQEESAKCRATVQLQS
jgi:hypothetical protein